MVNLQINDLLVARALLTHKDYSIVHFRRYIFGILLSLPDAIITKAFAPILILGAVGGTIIGLIVARWGV